MSTLTREWMQRWEKSRCTRDVQVSTVFHQGYGNFRVSPTACQMKGSVPMDVYTDPSMYAEMGEDRRTLTVQASTVLHQVSGTFCACPIKGGVLILV